MRRNKAHGKWFVQKQQTKRKRNIAQFEIVFYSFYSIAHRIDFVCSPFRRGRIDGGQMKNISLSNCSFVLLSAQTIEIINNLNAIRKHVFSLTQIEIEATKWHWTHFCWRQKRHKTSVDAYFAYRHTEIPIWNNFAFRSIEMGIQFHFTPNRKKEVHKLKHFRIFFFDRKTN